MPKLFVLLAVIFQGGGAVDAERDALARTRSEYPAALQRLREKYSHVRAEGTETLETRGKDGVWAVASTSRLEYRIDGPNKKITRVWTGVVPKGRPWKSVSCNGPQYGFWASVKEQGGATSLDRLEAANDERFVHQIDLGLGKYISAPFAAGASLPKVVEQPSFQVASARPSADDGGRTLDIELQCVVEIQRVGLKTMQYLVNVNPDRDWEVNRSRMRGLGQTIEGRTSRITYRADPTGNLVPRQVVLDAGPDRSTFDFDTYEFGPTPASEFTLSACGLPELNLTRPPRRSDWTPWALIAGGLACAGVAVGLMVRSRRGRRG